MPGTLFTKPAVHMLGCKHLWRTMSCPPAAATSQRRENWQNRTVRGQFRASRKKIGLFIFHDSRRCHLHTVDIRRSARNRYFFGVRQTVCPRRCIICLD